MKCQTYPAQLPVPKRMCFDDTGSPVNYLLFYNLHTGSDTARALLCLGVLGEFGIPSLEDALNIAFTPLQTHYSSVLPAFSAL